MWIEPLAATASRIDDYRYRVDVRESTGDIIAEVLCLISPTARFGHVARLRIDPDGGPRQKRRAIVLAVREACRHAQALGITTCTAEFTPALRALGERLAGVLGVPSGDRFYVRVDLNEMRSRLLAITDDQGGEVST